MWNDWVANAKKMAADIDTKLTESVGIDTDATAIGSVSATSTAATPAPIATELLEGANEDAWNDDLDFGDEDDGMEDVDVSGDAKDVEKPPVAAPPQQPKPKVLPPVVAAPKTAITETKPNEPPTQTTTHPVDKTNSDSGLFSLVSQTVSAEKNTGGVSSLLATTMSAASKLAEKTSETAAATTASQDDAPNVESPTTTEVAQTGDASMDAGDDGVATKDPVETSIPPAEEAAEHDIETEKANDNSGWDENIDLNVDAEEEVAKETTDTPPEKDSPPVAEKEPPVSVTGGGLFSNLTSLAQNEDSLLTAAVQKNSGEDGEITQKEEETRGKDEDTRVVETEMEISVEESPKKVETPVDKPPNEEDSGDVSEESGVNVAEPDDISSNDSSPPSDPAPTKTLFAAPKLGGRVGLFSNLTSLAKTADSMLTNAIESGKEGAEKNDEPVDTSGWEDEEDDALFGDDEDDELPPVREKQTTLIADSLTEGKEESASSYVNVSPTSSLSSEQDIKQKETRVLEPLPQTSKEDATGGSSGEAIITGNIEDHPQFKQLREALRLREDQLMNKGSQLNELQLLLESRDEQYKKKLQDTKEEAKKRIQRAKERCEVAEAKLRTRSSGDSDDAKKKQLIIDELMEEGQALAQKQSAMEQMVRAANSETRALNDRLEDEIQKKDDALEKIVELEAEVKSLKGYLASARQGESQAGKLETNLLAVRADAEEKANTILSLQQRVKELMAESKELKHEIDTTRKSAAHVAQQEKTSMRREHNDLLSDLEQKLRTTEREAGVREDALRHEVSEIRKRWQDAVRRADSLSMDIQSSTAPLLRQLESMERQSRLRTANASELESRLRAELEEATIEKERLGKDCSDFRSKLSRLERSMKEREQEIAAATTTIDEQLTTIDKLTRSKEKLETEAEKREIEYVRVEKLANEGVARVRSEMTQTVVDSEERYRGQIDKMEAELKVEREKRGQLEDQVNQLLENVTGGMFSPSQPQSTGLRRESKPKKLHKAEGQAEILAGALGLGDDSDDNDSDDDFDLTDMDDFDSGQDKRGSFNSFAALEQLTSRLKTAEVELGSMRKSLKESNQTRQSLVEELGEARHAKEKLPLFEQKVKELTQENREMEREIAGLKDDIADVRELYRTQLNVLLEEKTSSANINNGNKNVSDTSLAPAPQTNPEQTASKTEAFDDDW